MPFAISDVCCLAKESVVEFYERLPPPARRIGEPVIKALKTFIYFISEIRLQLLLFECSAESAEQQFRMLYVGRYDQVQPVLGLLKCRASRPIQLKSLFAWQIIDYLDHLELKPELTVIHVNTLLYGYLKPEGFFRMPASVNSVLTLSETKEKTRTHFSERTVRKIKRVVSHDFSWDIRNDRSALMHFYSQMYKPYLQQRFGPFAIVDSFYKVKRLLRTGVLVTVSKDGRLVSASICRIIDGVFWFELVGLENGQVDLLGASANDALYHAWLEIAFEMNCTHINFRNSRPFLNDGVLRYKQGWGTQLINDRKACRAIGVKINPFEKNQYNPFFEHYPIFIDHGNLSGFVLLNQEKNISLRQVRTIRNTFMHPGLNKLLVFSLNGFDDAVYEHFGTADDGVRIIDLSADAGSRKTFSDWLDGDL